MQSRINGTAEWSPCETNSITYKCHSSWSVVHLWTYIEGSCCLHVTWSLLIHLAWFVVRLTTSLRGNAVETSFFLWSWGDNPSFGRTGIPGMKQNPKNIQLCQYFASASAASCPLSILKSLPNFVASKMYFDSLSIHVRYPFARGRNLCSQAFPRQPLSPRTKPLHNFCNGLHMGRTTPGSPTVPPRDRNRKTLKSGPNFHRRKSWIANSVTYASTFVDFLVLYLFCQSSAYILFLFPS